jgi:hypothetical protein
MFGFQVFFLIDSLQFSLILPLYFLIHKMLPINSLLLTLCVQFITKVKNKTQNKFLYFSKSLLQQHIFCVWQQCLFIVQYMFFFHRLLLSSSHLLLNTFYDTFNTSHHQDKNFYYKSNK